MRALPILLTAALFAQEPLSIKVDVSLVNVAFIVRDESLTQDDVEVYEDGVRQSIRFFERSSALPLRLAMLLDGSGSQDRFNKQHTRDIGKFVSSALGPDDRALLVCFGNRIRLASDFTGSAAQLMDGLTAFQKGSRKFPELEPDDTRDGGTALFDSVYAVATRKFAEPGRERRAIVLFSDGEDNASAHDLLDAIEAAQTADASIFTVRYTGAGRNGLTAHNRYGIREMDRLAGETGGAAFDASTGDVAETLSRVAEDLRSMYELGYVSSNPVRDGRFRKVEIRLKRPGPAVRAKPGYFAR